MRTMMINGMLSAAIVGLAICSMAPEGQDAGGESGGPNGGGEANPDATGGEANQQLAEAEGAQQNETDGAAENQGGDPEPEIDPDFVEEADEDGEEADISDVDHDL